MLVFWPEIQRSSETTHRGWWPAAAFLCGALPLVIYNLTHASATVTENAHLDPRSVAGKWIQVRLAANGSSLFGYMAGDEGGRIPRLRSPCADAPQYGFTTTWEITGAPAFTTFSESCCWPRRGGGNTAQPDFHWSSWQ